VVSAGGMLRPRHRAVTPLAAQLSTSLDTNVQASAAKGLVDVALYFPARRDTFSDDAIDAMEATLNGSPDPVTKLASVGALDTLGFPISRQDDGACSAPSWPLLEAMAVATRETKKRRFFLAWPGPFRSFSIHYSLFSLRKNRLQENADGRSPDLRSKGHFSSQSAFISCLLYCCLPNFGRCGRSQDRVSVNCPLPDPLYPAEWMAETQFRTVDHPS